MDYEIILNATGEAGLLQTVNTHPEAPVQARYAFATRQSA